MDRHHLLQIILWPNGDGTYRTILNSRERLKELNIYNDFKMTITITHQQHMDLHNKYRSDETKKLLHDRLSGINNPMYGKEPWNKGKAWSDEIRNKISVSCTGRSPTVHTHASRHRISDSKIQTEFGRKYKEHYNMTRREDINLYYREKYFYDVHGYCRWEGM